MIFGGISSILALVRGRDHAVVLILPALLGVLGLLFLLGEVLVPH